MYDFDVLLDEILRNRPEMSRSKIIEQIQEKKSNIGSGYLTDQGALFLIAGELGVPLKHLTSSDLTLKDLYVGANDITIVARVLAIYPVSEYNRKDGGVGRYRRLNLFDKGITARLTIWDDNEEAIKLTGISVDTPLRVMNGYVRQGLDGKPNLNLGKRGKLEVLADDDLISKLTSLSKLSKKMGKMSSDEVSGNGDNTSVLAVEGIASTDGRASNFVRSSDGSPGSMMQFELSAIDGSAKTRVVIWNPGDVHEVKIGQTVRVTSIRLRKSNKGEIEFHGDTGSIVQLLDAYHDPASSLSTSSISPSSPLDAGSDRSIRFVKVEQIKEMSGRINLEVMALSNGVVRDVTLKDGSTVKKGELGIGDDTGEITIFGWGDAADPLARIEMGQRIRIYNVSRQVSKMGMELLKLERASRIEMLTPG